MAAKSRIRPFDALRAIRALIRNPDDTARLFDVIAALSGNHGERLFERFRRSPGGARLLAKRPDLLAALSDRARLASLPAGSPGRPYPGILWRQPLSAH